jgi:DNA-directed RNA polymerase subunit RPC12/RpoP
MGSSIIVYTEEEVNRKKFSCYACEAEFNIDHEMDEDEYNVVYCPFCSEKIDVDIDDWFEE